jgi:SRSO17 transposase
MDAKQIAGLGRELGCFLGEFHDCFGRSERRNHLEMYVCGQVSELSRKSVEPIAPASRTAQGA